MTQAELLAEFREKVNDKMKPYAWSDARAYRFLSLAQDQFCKDTGFFRDATTYSFSTEAGVASYPYSSRVIEILGMGCNGARLMRFFGDPLSATFLGVNFDPAAASLQQPAAYRTDYETGMVTLYPTPDAVYPVTMRVWRKSKLPLSSVNAPELPEEFELGLVEYAAALAYGDHDRERQDPVKAAEHAENYKKYAREGRHAFRRLCAGSATAVPNPLYVV